MTTRTNSINPSWYCSLSVEAASSATATLRRVSLSTEISPAKATPEKNRSDNSNTQMVRGKFVFITFPFQCPTDSFLTLHHDKKVASASHQFLHNKIDNVFCQSDRKSTRLNSSHMSISY